MPSVNQTIEEAQEALAKLSGVNVLLSKELFQSIVKIDELVQGRKAMGQLVPNIPHKGDNLPTEVLAEMLAYAPTILVELKDDDDDPTILFAGRLIEEMLGFMQGELEWRPLSTVIPDSSREKHRLNIAAHRLNPQDRNMAVFLGKKLAARKKNGEPLPCLVYLKSFGCQGRRFSFATVMPIPEELKE